MDYYRYIIIADAPSREIILAFLGELPFDTFEETDEGLNAYLRADADAFSVEQQLSDISGQLSFSYERELVKHQNWNAVWESNFQPIQVEEFCGVRAPFHEPMKGVRYEIIINPEMAFGTGHHETTHMMIAGMQHPEWTGKAVFDYGCGTGILAILAGMLGATEIDAVDIEKPAYESTVENAKRNGVPHLKAYFGDLSKVPERTYDIILANINRNVILNSLEALYNRLNAGGQLLASGILQVDKAMVTERAALVGFECLETMHRGDWCCLQFEKKQ
ncbi:MAG: 50S ribosomal protein L11 methyltransferase [Phaeodactylibacter sp.]|uniref:50S ribosomal protein L11 methyltransferase n=1 Tax=Phaeodactylibacter sp. TaxID=1940289 RepID=UPI0032EF553A